MKSLIWIAYGILLTGGVALFWSRRPPPPPVAFEAAVDLPAGHRLAQGDIRLPGGEHYLRRRIAAGGTVTARDLIALPPARAPFGMVPMTVALAPGARADAIESRRSAWLCPVPQGFTTVPVLTLICAQDGKTCLAVVGIPRNQAKAVGSAPHHISETQCR